jgi:hypothetical protein
VSQKGKRYKLEGECKGLKESRRVRRREGGFSNKIRRNDEITCICAFFVVPLRSKEK